MNLIFFILIISAVFGTQVYALVSEVISVRKMSRENARLKELSVRLRKSSTLQEQEFWVSEIEKSNRRFSQIRE